MSEPVRLAMGSTGAGSLPGASAVEAMRLAFGESLEIPYMAELPARGAGADMIGRTAARLVDIHIEIQPSSWRVTRRPGMDAQRANDYWAWDLDAVQVAAEGYVGPLKIQLVGPWTLGSSLELVNGHRFLTDEGALRDLQESLGEGAAQLLREIRRRVPGASPILQLDEPSLPAVLAGSIPTASGFGRINAVGTHEAGLGLERVIGAVSGAGDDDVPVVVHSCAANVPFGLIRQAGAQAVMVDCSLLSTREYDDLGAAVDEGLDLFLGVIPSRRAIRRGDVDAAADRARGIAAAVGMSARELISRVGLTTACGLAGVSWDQAVTATRTVAAASRQLSDNPTLH